MIFYFEQIRNQLIVLTVSLSRPFTKRSLYEMNQMAYDLVNNGASNPDVFILPDQCRPVLQFSMVGAIR